MTKVTIPASILAAIKQRSQTVINAKIAENALTSTTIHLADIHEWTPREIIAVTSELATLSHSTDLLAHWQEMVDLVDSENTRRWEEMEGEALASRTYHETNRKLSQETW